MYIERNRPSASRILLIVALMEEVQSVVSEEKDFEYREL